MSAHAVIDNIRKRLVTPTNSNESLSSIMSNVSLSAYLHPTQGVAVAAFKVATTTPSAMSISEGITRLFKGELGVVEGSLKVLEKTKFYTSVSAHLMRNTVTRALANGIPKGFISLSKNIFMEERDAKTWKLITTDEGKQILVRDNMVETDEDMEKLLSSLSSVGHQYSQEAKRLTATARSAQELEEGVLVSFVTKSSTQELGFVVSIDQHGDFGVCNSAYHQVSRNSIIHSFDLSTYYSQLNLPKVEITANSSTDINFKIDYYKKVFGYNQDFLQKWLDKIKSNGMV